MIYEKQNLLDKIRYRTALTYSFIVSQLWPVFKYGNEVPGLFKKWDRLIYNWNDKFTGELPTKFRMVTWNVERAYEAQEIIDAIPKFNCNLVLLQEVPKIEEGKNPLFSQVKEFFSYMPVVFFKKKSKSENFLHFGQLTLSDYNFNSIRKVPFSRVTFRSHFHNGRRYARRAALYTKFNMGNGKSLGLYNIHCEIFTKASGRKKQILELMEEIESNHDSHVIIAGDFNSWMGRFEPSYKILKKKGYNRVHHHGETCGIFLLDNIFCSSNVAFDSRVEYIKGSDHYPIIADIELL